MKIFRRRGGAHCRGADRERIRRDGFFADYDARSGLPRHRTARFASRSASSICSIDTFSFLATISPRIAIRAANSRAESNAGANYRRRDHARASTAISAVTGVSRDIFRGRVRINRIAFGHRDRLSAGCCQDPEKGEAGFLEQLKIARAFSLSLSLSLSLLRK